MKAFVFVGPTLSAEKVLEAVPSAIVLPPVARGDILRLVLDSDPSAIAIIDGYFNTVPAVTHKEVLFALSRGFRVLGASSMGALRAAEMWPFGMEGVGEIFTLYRDGVLEADDEVAVTHGPPESGYRASSVALANIRLALKEAARRGIIATETERHLVADAKSVFYADRSWEHLFAQAKRDGIHHNEVKALESFIISERPDAKRDDALEMLVQLSRACDESKPPSQPEINFDFEPTIFWERLVIESRSVASLPDFSNDLVITLPEIERHFRLPRRVQDARRGAALLSLLMARERIQQRPMSEDVFRRAIRTFRRRRGLLSADAVQKWCQRQNLSEQELALLIRLEVVLDSLLVEEASEMRDLLPLELKRIGNFDTLARLITKKKLALEQAGAASLTLDDIGLTFGELMTWYQNSFESIDDPVRSYAESLGFTSTRQFLSEIMLEYKVRNTPGEEE